MTLDADQLKVNTTYYLRLNPVSNEDIAYSALVTETPADVVVPGSNQNNAVLVPKETLVHIHVPMTEYAWLSFTTGNKQMTYRLTTVRETTHSADMHCTIQGEFGTEYGKNMAEDSGIPSTLELDNLAPNTTYYLRMCAANVYDDIDQDVSLIIRDSNHKINAHKTTDKITESVDPETLIQAGAVPGTDANIAMAMPFNYKYSGLCPHSEYQWFSFITEDNAKATYKVAVVNEAQNSDEMIFDIMDIYGNIISTVEAYKDGTTQSLDLNGLTPNMLYYTCLHIRRSYAPEDQNYSLRIVTSEPVEETPLVFETPFEINETQVQFAVNQAVFIDKLKAMTALQPVAEAILAHPDRTILIAGSTATDGTQESCIGLSVQRAEAVRDLLVNTYGVPVSQLKVVGMGYADDPFERGQDIDANGNFVESEAVKNRRVVILDAEDPIAKELLKKAK